MPRSIVAGEPGFEPRQTESESVVLPLHHSPKFAQDYNALGHFLGRLGRVIGKRGPFYPFSPCFGKRGGEARDDFVAANPRHNNKRAVHEPDPLTPSLIVWFID